MNFNYLDDEEREIIESVENSEDWTFTTNKKELEYYKKMASNTLRKTKRINLRLHEQDLNHIKKRAVVEGMPYQTLISSIIHKYLNGELIPRQ